jgi:hypothetical protein
MHAMNRYRDRYTIARCVVTLLSRDLDHIKFSLFRCSQMVRSRSN